MRRLWRDYNLTIVAAGLFFVSFLAWALVAWKDYSSEADRHGESAEFGPFMSRFWASRSRTGSPSSSMCSCSWS